MLRECVVNYIGATYRSELRGEVLRNAFRSCKADEYFVALEEAADELEKLADVDEKKHRKVSGNSDSERLLIIEAKISASVAE
jgi:hypothetical protein